MWQDSALTLINFGFIITLIPAVIRNFKLKDVQGQSFYTYFSTAVLLSILVYVFFTLELILSSVSTGLTAIMWYVLTYQKLRYSS